MLNSPSANENKVGPDFNKTSSNGKVFTIQKGQLNKLRLRPQILNEHAESSRNVQGTVAAGTIVGQIFKASHDNINGISLTLESALGVSIDDFEGYANSAALQAAWILTGSNAAELETTIVAPGGSTKSMNLPLDALNDEWQLTIGATNYSGFTFDFDFYQTRNFANAKVAFFIGDGVNTKSIQLAISAINTWERFEVNEAAMTDDGGGSPVMTTITEIGFRVDDAAVNFDAYVDDLNATPAPGQVELKLFDMGATIPVTGVTALDDGTQYTELGDRGIGGSVAASIILDLEGGKRLYSIQDFVAGVAFEIPTNAPLNEQNYYALTINYVDTNVDVYGPNEAWDDYYENGYAFTAASEAAAIAQVGGGGSQNDLMFKIFSTQEAFINTLVKNHDAEPGINATEQIYVENDEMRIENIMVGSFRPLQAVQAFFDTRPSHVPKGGKFEVYYNDDSSDSVTVASILIGFIYQEMAVNG